MSAAQERAPSREAPEHGVIGYHEFIVSTVAYWIEDGDHVFRSAEFDVLAADPDFATAVCKFVENAEDYAHFLADLVEQDDATPEEAEAAVALLERFSQVYRAEKLKLEKQAQQMVRINLRRGRRRGHHRRAGYERSTHESSSQLQTA